MWTSACQLLYTGFLLDLFFDPEGGSDMFLWNINRLSTDYTALYPRKYNSSLIYSFMLSIISNAITSLGSTLFENQIRLYRGTPQ
jgi:hypothetical protein